MRSIGSLATILSGKTLPALDFLPAVLPAAWRLDQMGSDGAFYMRADGLAVIASASEEDDGRRWLHVSCSRKSRIPSYEDLADVKALFIGADRYAYQVFAPRSKHVNQMPFCLHLWCCLGVDEGAVLPDFTRGGTTL